MNVAVLGRNKINSILKEQLDHIGITPLAIEDVGNIESVKGEKGDFIIRTREGAFNAACILVTEEPSFSGVLEYKGVITLEEDMDLCHLPYSSIPVVFILDYPAESPSYMTRLALDKALCLARRKRKVVYLSKFMRTAGENLEILYREARSTGVIFFKYDSITMEYSDEKQAFHICASDTADSLEIFTNTPVLGGEGACSDAFSRLAKMLKLKHDSEGRIDGDKFFLFPCLLYQES
jgi:hypothetical protein